VKSVSPATRNNIQSLISNVIVNGEAYEYERQIADDIGLRLTGSQKYMNAVRWSEQKFRELGLSNVHRETFTISTWEPGEPATGRIVSPSDLSLRVYAFHVALYHKASDTFDPVDKRTFMQGVATFAATAYAIAHSESRFAAHFSPAGCAELCGDPAKSMLTNLKNKREFWHLFNVGTSSMKATGVTG
jgi:hypothetical protein